MALTTMVTGLLLLHAAAGGAAPPTRVADCAAYEEVRAQIRRGREMLAEGKSEDELPPFEVDSALRRCFREQVLPELVRAETNDQLIDAAANGFFEWARQPALLGITERFAAEDAQGIASLTRGLSHAYALARDKCIRLHDTRQIDVMLRLLRWAQLRGMELTTAFPEDIEACIRGAAYVVQVNRTTTSAKHGLGSQFRYTAVVRPVPRGEAGELTGKGTYGGYVISRYANCKLAEKGGGEQRFDVSGRLDASGTVVGTPSATGKGTVGFMYVLKSLDWNLKPMWGGDSPYAETPEEREGLAGGGSIFAIEPITLTGKSTTHVQSSSHENTCSGETTTRVETRIVKVSAAR